MIDLVVPVLGAITTLVGVVVIITNIYFLKRSDESKDWIQTTGVIFSSEVERTLNPSKNIFEDYFKASIKYKYVVDGVEFIGDRVYFGSNVYSSDQSIAKNIVNNYPIRKIITVYYNPINHKDAVIDRAHKSIWAATILSILLITAGIFLILNRTNIEQLLLGI